MKRFGRLFRYPVFLKTAVFFIALMAAPLCVFAAHPLITDDTGTQGKGKFQIEANAEVSKGVEETVGEAAASFSSGITDEMDLVLGVPYVIAEEGGLSDAAVEIKWRFFDTEHFSFALKPGVSIPTGGDASSEDLSYGAALIITKEAGGISFHTNFSYEKSPDENLLGASFAVAAGLGEKLSGVFDIAAKGDLDTDDEPPAYIIGGLIYGIKENLDIDAGVRVGITAPADDIAFLFGTAWRF